MNDPTTYVVASLSPSPQLYSYATSEADAHQKALAANQYEADHSKEGQPPRRYATMTEAAYEEAQRQHYASLPLQAISRERFDEMLNILPPVAWRRDAGFETFLMSEFETGTYTTMFARLRDRCFSRVVNAMDRSTWITPEECLKAAAPSGFVGIVGGRDARTAGQGAQR